MAPLAFLKQPPPSTLAEIAALTGATLVDPARGADLIRGLASLEQAGPMHLAFHDSGTDSELLTNTHAGACLVTELFEHRLPPHVALLRASDPVAAFVAVAGAFYPDALRPQSWFGQGGISPSAVIHPSARLEDGVVVDPLVIIGAGAEIGSDTVIAAGAVVGAHVRIGRDCSIGAGATVQFALIGNNVLIHPGCHIGQDSQGFVAGPQRPRIPHTGRVLIQNDVEIGAGTTIDRGRLGDTVIGEGSKIDNQVQIGHNVAIGRYCRLAAHVGLAGDLTLSDGAEMARGGAPGTNETKAGRRD